MNRNSTYDTAEEGSVAAKRENSHRQFLHAAQRLLVNLKQAHYNVRQATVSLTNAQNAQATVLELQDMEDDFSRQGMDELRRKALRLTEEIRKFILENSPDEIL